MIGFGTFDGLETMNAMDSLNAHKESMRMNESELAYSIGNGEKEHRSERIEKRYCKRFLPNSN